MKKRELASGSKLLWTAEGSHCGKPRSRNTRAALVSSPLGVALSKTLDSPGLGKKYLNQEHQSKATLLTRAKNPNALTVLRQAFSFNHLIEESRLRLHKNLLTTISQTAVCHWTQSLLWMSSVLLEEIWLGILFMGHKCENDLLIPWYLTSSLSKSVPGKQNFIALLQGSWIEPRGSLAYDLSHVLLKLIKLFPCFILDNKVKSEYKRQKATCKKSYQKTPKKSND